ncbi:MAG: tripartite tricarboxylate transporter TctB family protein [Thermodesulfobacteriota bacterium]
MMFQALSEKLEALFCLGLAIFFTIILVMSIHMGFGSVKNPGPGFFPAFLSIFGIAFSVSLLVQHVSAGGRAEPGKGLFATGQGRRFLAIIASFCGWLILMPWLGFIMVTFFAALAFAKIMGLEGWRHPILLAIGASVFIYLLFDVWFYADLPRGIWH